MEKLQLVVLGILLIFVMLGQRVNAQTDAEIRSVMSERLSGADSKIGIVIAVIDEKGTRFVAHPDNKSAAATVYEIGSVTKVFTAELLAEMVGRGEVSLDDPVSKFLPATVKVPTRNGKQITLLHLATHTSGLPRLPGNFKPANPLNPYADYSVENLYDFLSKHELARDPGEKYEYSNLGMGLLGHALSLRAKMSYEDAVKKRILEPLGMKNTVMTLTPEMRTRLAPGHNPLGKPTPNWDLSVLSGAGSFRSTPEDMAMFVAANMGLKKSNLSEAFALAHEPRTSAGSPVMRIGLGWHVLNKDGSEITWHNGETGGYKSFAGFNKKLKKGVVILANMPVEMDDIGMYLLGAGELQKVLEIAPEILDKYVGEYELAPEFVLTVTRAGKKLFVQATNQPQLQVFAESETDFFYKQVKAKIKFTKNEKGEVTSLTLFQGGREMPARKIK